DLHRAYRPAARRAAADIIDQFAQSDAEADLEQAAILHIAGKLDRHGAARSAEADCGIALRPLSEDEGDSGEAQHIVDHRRPAEQAADRRKRRLGADLPALALDRFEHRGFLAAD